MAPDQPPQQTVVHPSHPPTPPGNWSYPYPAQDEISLSEIWSVLFARKYMIALAALVTAVLAAASTYLMRPVFRAEVLIAPATEQRNQLGALAALGGLAELAGVNVGGGGNRAVAVATLKSRSLTEAFIQERRLLPVLFENRWDAANNRWKEGDAEKTPTLWDACLQFNTIRRIQEDRKTGLVTLAVEWHDPQAAADWANELVKRTNAKLQQATITEGQKTIAYLEQQLARAGALEVRQALYSLIEMETKNIAVAHAREEFAFKVIDPAVVPRKKVRPNRFFITVLGFSLGAIVSAFVALVKAARTPGGFRQ